VTQTAAEILDAIGIDAICERIESGESQSEISQSLGFDKSHLTRWINRDPQRSARAQAAREASAEAWIDRGIARLDQACDKLSGIDPTAARAYAQECARRAAQRNPKYRETTETRLDVSVTVNALSQRLREGRQQITRTVIEQLPDNSDDDDK